MAHRQTQGGPPLAALALISAILVGVGVGAGWVMAGRLEPSPFASPQTITAFFRHHRDAVQATAFFHFASAVPLAIYAATVHARLRNLGVRAPGASIALAGGLLAAGMWMLSACFGWVLARSEVAGRPSLVWSFHDAGFITGGPAHIVFFGLLIAGISVPALFAQLLPRSLGLAGLVIAVLAELSTLVLVTEWATWLLVIVRGAGLAWLIVAGALLPTSRRREEATPPRDPSVFIPGCSR
jgi:hypothetical protein